MNDCLVDKILTPGLRVTVKLEPNQDLRSKKVRGKIVSPLQPRQETGVYWGYTVRIAKSLSDIFTKSEFSSGYDLTVGTSDKGKSINTIEKKSLKYNHALVVYGGVLGLEAALENDDNLDVDDPSLLFDEYINVVPNQGKTVFGLKSCNFILILFFINQVHVQSEQRKQYLSHWPH